MSLLTLLSRKRRKPITSPTDLSGMMAWYDATDAASITMSANKVSQWNDKSGNGNNITQATAAQQPLYVAASPINGKPSIKFNDGGANSGLAVADNSTLKYTAFTLVLVAQRVTDQNTQEFVFGKYDPNTTQREFQVTIEAQAADNVGTVLSTNGSAAYAPPTGPAVAVGATFVPEFTYDNIDRIFTEKLNNASAMSVTLPSNVFNGTAPLFLGTRPGFTGSPSAYISEVMWWKRRLNNAELAQLYGYINAKYGTAL